MPVSTIVDWRQIQRWGIDESRLPPGTDIRFKQPTLWEAYRTQAIIFTAVGVAQLMLIAALAVALQRRRVAEATRLQAEVRAAQLRDELAHSARVTMMGELATTLAHEINQPLAAILSNAQATRRWLKADHPNLDEVRATVDDIIADDKRAGEIIHRMRALMKKGDHKPQRIDLAKAIRDVAALLQGELIAADVTLRLDLPPEALPVDADEVATQQVLLNLMMNGIQAMQGGRRAHPALARARRPRRRIGRGHGARHRQGHFRGDARAALRTVLHHQDDRAGRRARHLPPHRGSARRAPGRRRGTHRWRHVPVLAADTADRAVTMPATVFVVDDDASVRTSLSRLLRSAGFDVEAYASGEQFVARGPFDGVGCVVLDLMMPGASGTELQQRLTELSSDLPVVFLSGHGAVSDGVRAMKQGAVDFLTKPVDEEVLLATIDAAVARHRAARAARDERDAVRRRVETLTATRTRGHAVRRSAAH